MQRPVRHQVEDDVTRQLYGELSGVDCSDRPDLARQEFKAEADTTTLLRRYGAVPPPPPMGGEFDFDWTLHSSLEAIREVADGFQSLPADVRRAYPTPGELIQAVLRGEVTYKAEPAAEVPSAAGAASPSAARQEGQNDA